MTNGNRRPAPWRRLIGALMTATLVTGAIWLTAAGGDLDPSFGTGGTVATDFPVFFSEFADAVAIQPDGRIVAAGSVFNPTNSLVADYDFALARYLSDGSLDPSFGSGGLVTTDFFANSLDAAHDIALQGDGKIVVAGRAQAQGGHPADFAVARYLPTGGLDPMFGTGGKVTIRFVNNSEAAAVAVQQDGKIVLAGYAVDEFFVADFALARLNLDGGLDATFGTGGRVTTNVSMTALFELTDLANAVAIQPDGKIIAGGTAVRPHAFGFDAAEMALVRYESDGSLDPGFGNAGRVSFSVHDYRDGVTDLAVQPDGRIIATGWTLNPNGSLRTEFAAARLEPNGRLDSTFGVGGKAIARFEPIDDLGGSLDATARASALQPDGRIVLSGTVGNNIALARFAPNGSLDLSFGAGGMVTTDLGGYESAAAVALQQDGRIVTAGGKVPITGGGNAAALLLVRYDRGGGTVAQTIDFAPLPDRLFGADPFPISATASSGLPVHFTATGACTVLDTTVTLTGSGTCAITASQPGDETYAPATDVTRAFEVRNAHTLTVVIAGTGIGHVTSSPGGIDCGTACTATYPVGTNVTLTPMPGAGSTFAGWSGDADCLDGIITMAADVTCGATFDRTGSVTTISSSANPSTFGQLVAFTAVVAGASPTGTVTFFDGSVPLGAPVALAAGSATISIESLGAGTHSITAAYSGDASNAASTSLALNQQVNQAVPLITLASSANPSIPMAAVTLSGTVMPTATGTVTVFDNAASLGDVAIVSGSYALVVPLAQGSHPLRARYNGDANHAATESAVLTQVVDTPPIIGAIADRTVAWGSPIDIMPVVSDGDGDPLTFNLIGAPAGAAIDAAGRLTWTPTSAQTGTYPLTIEASDGILTASAAFSLTVRRRTTGIMYTGPSVANAGPIELSARLTDELNAPVAARVVTFQLGTQTTSGTTDALGVSAASLTLTQPPGVLPLTTSFAGDAAYESTTSGPFDFRVDAPPIIAPVGARTIPWGQTLTFVVDAADPDGGALTFSLPSAPPGVQMSIVSSTSRRIDWTPTSAQVGPASIVIGVSDGTSLVTASVPVDVTRRAASITDLAPGTGAGSVILTARLADAVAGTPIAGRMLAFNLGSQFAAAPTDATGLSSAALALAQAPGIVPLVASFAGDLLYAPDQATRPFTIVLDTDGDGIRDEWEISGVDVDGNGSIDLNLPAMGAHPLRKDVFVEVDWMVKPTACVWLVCWSNGGVLQPQRVVLDAIIASFAAAPVANPDGSTGITLHVDGGPNTVMNPATGEPWGPLSRAGVVPYAESLGSVDAAGDYDWSEFEALKQAFMEPARRVVFHYAIYANMIGVSNAGGISRGIPGADFILAAGHSTWNGGLTMTQERSLFMHELGHNLHLRHGGADDINYKPNYNSVLNYRWSLTGVPPSGQANYSTVVEAAIDENVIGDVNGDGSIDVLLGHEDWTNLRFDGGGIGDLQALPAPMMTPLDPIDPDELRTRGAYARSGDGLLEFKGPSVLVMNSGMQSLAIDVENISDTDSGYLVSAASPLFATALTTAAAAAGGEVTRVTLPIDTAGLAPGTYPLTLTLQAQAGELVHQQVATITVVDLSVAENQESARQAIEALRALPPDSGLDPVVREQIIAALDVPFGWLAEVRVTGRPAFDAAYEIAEPFIGGIVGRISVQSLPGSAICRLELLRAGKAAAGVVRLQMQSGEMFEAPVAGLWNAKTRVFEGKWHLGKRSGGIVFRMRAPSSE